MEEPAQHSAGKGVRRHTDLQQKFGSIPSEQITTLMLRKVPRRYTEEALLCELEACMSLKMLTFFYLPWDSRRDSNAGYAFVDCVDSATAKTLHRHLDGKSWKLIKAEQTIRVVPAHVQGIARNLIHYVSSTVIADAHCPIVFREGMRISFQEALETYCPPELFRKYHKFAPTSQGSSAWSPGLVETSAASQPFLAQLSTESSLSNFALPDMSDGSKHSLKAVDHSVHSEPASSLKDDGASNPGLVQLLTSASYRTAWETLNWQLQALVAHATP